MLAVAPTPHPAQPQPRTRSPDPANPLPPLTRPAIPGPRPPARPRPRVCTRSPVQSGPIQTRHSATLPVFGASQAPAGAVVFHRFLQDLNRTPHATALPTNPHCRPHCPIQREPDHYEPAPPARASSVGLLPTLGDLPPTTPAPAERHVTEVRHLQSTPITGRLIDLLA